MFFFFSFNSKTQIASKHGCVIWLQANSSFGHQSLLFSGIGVGGVRRGGGMVLNTGPLMSARAAGENNNKEK